ncbi:MULTISPECIES: FlgO family outer membrane protein [Pseudoalteromonas]|nr:MULTISPECIES: FlgO family outer membrane protein [Pseudoalteromonas]MDN3404594.1 FlgO family outer membrane protein [Pseudoalteromonas sp. APC 3218]MDN3409918.1 FlgO family outer membrane protein [Pseudoalteromonas sp. APC 3894]MDN3415067.1 FlgO family outer membrane protein [Pseudoalteromonas sp. APC 3227]MDN3418765.1 FlgO family outer membrane protein [Pseudoalteromonas sp. APC 3895]MDN3424303.1 FlgO family outer membrane protein [Pseudoalteromonas sp. APC 3896]|tara:strand:- start:2278 stop:2955 length:678 start_codon:yes stop_codon:yes gene_type:complete
MANLAKRSALISISALSLLLSGCNLLGESSMAEPAKAEPEQTVVSNLDFNQIMAQMQRNDEQEQYADTTQFNPNKHHKSLVNYVEQMALDLTDTMQVAPQDAAIAVTSFVDLDASLTTASQLGNQLSETFIHQLQKFGYSAVDFKTANLITVNKQGDFAFTRNTRKLAGTSIASHVLSGTLIYREDGVEINARVIDIQSKRLAASSRTFIPLYVLNKEDIYLSSN